MLHEIFLALSGHPSPIFGKGSVEDVSHDGVPLLSPSEKALLKSIGHLAEVHRHLRTQLDAIASSHHSTICRSVANSIRQTHLSRFQDKILDVERRILVKDTSVVGAYDIVPLASVVGEFDGWHRRMGWYWAENRQTDTAHEPQIHDPSVAETRGAEIHAPCTATARLRW
jgi:hypothetical protein